MLQGDRHELTFTISDADMLAFEQLSGDASPIHTDRQFAIQNGFSDKIVYGGLLIAKLSGMLGGFLPGPSGFSVQWDIRFKSPLYVGEQATLAAVVENISPAARLAEIKYTISGPRGQIAAGNAKSRLVG